MSYSDSSLMFVAAVSTAVYCEDVSTAMHGEDVNTAMHGEDVNTAMHGEDVNTAMHGEDVNTAMHWEDVNTAMHGEDVNTAMHGEDVNTAMHGEDVNTAMHWEDVNTAMHGEDVSTAMHGEDLYLLSTCGLLWLVNRNDFNKVCLPYVITLLVAKCYRPLLFNLARSLVDLNVWVLLVAKAMVVSVFNPNNTLHHLENPGYYLLSPGGQSSHVPSIDVSTAVGITFSITFIMAFSLGVLVTVCIFKTRSKTTSPHHYTPNAPNEVVGINQKKIDVILIESNAAYGRVQ
eukprot:Em0039g20a